MTLAQRVILRMRMRLAISLTSASPRTVRRHQSLGHPHRLCLGVDGLIVVSITVVGKWSGDDDDSAELAEVVIE